MEILTGIAAGERGVNGLYPPGTINFRVEQRLSGFADRAVAARAPAALQKRRRELKRP
jgi:hypothetical protein